jgi:hypothetical protein
MGFTGLANALIAFSGLISAHTDEKPVNSGLRDRGVDNSNAYPRAKICDPRTSDRQGAVLCSIEGQTAYPGSVLFSWMRAARC